MNKNSLASKVFFIITYLILEFGQTSFAQNIVFSSGMTQYSNTQVFRLKAWKTMSGRQWLSVIYRYPNFLEGSITLANGFSPTAKMKLNYNVYDDKMEFVTEDGDTSVLENAHQLKAITIGNHVYVNDYPIVFVEKLNQTSVALGSKHLIKMMFESNNGEVFEASNWHQPTARLDRLFVKKDEFYFIDKNGRMQRATQPNIMKIYSSTKKEVKKYIKTIKVDFKNKEDLIGLLEFCKKYDNKPSP